MTRPDLDALQALPVAWLQVGIGGGYEGLVLLRKRKPKYDATWWKFEPLYAADALDRARNRIAELEQERDAALARVRELEAGRDSARDEETGRTLTARQWKARYQDCEMSYRNASSAWNHNDAASRRAAAIAMRERAAQACYREAAASSLGHKQKAIWQSQVAGRCAAAILALEP